MKVTIIISLILASLSLTKAGCTFSKRVNGWPWTFYGCVAGEYCNLVNNWVLDPQSQCLTCPEGFYCEGKYTDRLAHTSAYWKTVGPKTTCGPLKWSGEASIALVDCYTSCTEQGQ